MLFKLPNQCFSLLSLNVYFLGPNLKYQLFPKNLSPFFLIEFFEPPFLGSNKLLWIILFFVFNAAMISNDICFITTSVSSPSKGATKVVLVSTFPVSTSTNLTVPK